MKRRHAKMNPLLRSRILFGALAAILSVGVFGTGLAQGPDKLARLSEKKLYAEAERALEKRNAGRSQPRPHKKYTPLQLQLGRELADREATLGVEACNAMNLQACEERLKSAREFTSTEKVRKLAALLQEKHSTLKGHFSSAVSMAETGGEEEALKGLRSLAPYSDYLPALDDEIFRIEQAYADTLMRDGLKLLDFKNWGKAEDLFQRAAALGRDDPRIATALDRVERGRKAYELAARAPNEGHRGVLRGSDEYNPGGDRELSGRQRSGGDQGNNSEPLGRSSCVKSGVLLTKSR